MFQPKQPFVIAAFPRREAAEALKARNMTAQGKHAESVLALGLDFGQFFLFKNKSKNEFAFYLLRIMLPVA
ncbi:MAG: hypothetical protein GX574_07710 [Lentisphaerae bacterium]|nr:hypothetical protein [Lentisphaerota bacterium]